MRKNIIMNADSYKPSHYLQMPKRTSYSSSYIESRGCDIPGWNETTFFGLQMFIKEYLMEPFTQEDIEEASEMISSHGEPFNREGWEYILKEHSGYLPVRIQAIPEGTTLPVGHVQVQIINTDPKVPWLPSYLETCLHRAVWYPTTVASQDLYIKRTILKYLRDTSTSELPETDVLFKLHDFGGRGASSNETAGIGGCAHLVHFRGTDTMEALRYARYLYGEPMAGFSIPAAEHMTITIWGGPENEIEAFENMIDQFAGEGKLYAVVSDSYDIYAACDKWFSLRDKIVEKGGTLVVRPDSGHPPTVVVEVIKKLMNLFGFTTNKKGYRVLPDYLRVIQGDGINHESIEEILENMKQHKLSADNIAFGMGGAMLQHPNRDWFKYAMKASAAEVNGVWKDVYKDPVGDNTKKSKKGILALVKRNGEFVTVREKDLLETEENILETVFLNGRLLRNMTLTEIRALADKAVETDLKRAA